MECTRRHCNALPSSSSSSFSSPSSSSYPISSPLESITSLFSLSRPPPSPSLPPLTPPSSSRSSLILSYLPPSIASPIQAITSTRTGVAVLSATSATVLTAGTILCYRRYWKRIRTADYVTQGMLNRKRWIKGVVTSVGDGDNFRIFHTPGPFYSWPLRLRKIPNSTKDLKDQTIHIRIAGVDAPEAAHFGRPSQPHSQESLDWLRETLLGNREGSIVEGGGKRMWVQVLRRDQYGRIVGVPLIRRWIFRDIPLPILMLQKGMAVVYDSAGGEYGKWGIEEMKKVEKVARDRKIGLWSLPPSETPAEYKRRYRVGEESVVKVDKEAVKGTRWVDWLRRVFASETWRGPLHR